MTEWQLQETLQQAWAKDGLILNGKRLFLAAREVMTDWESNDAKVRWNLPSADFLLLDERGRLVVVELKMRIRSPRDCVLALCQVTHMSVRLSNAFSSVRLEAAYRRGVQRLTGLTLAGVLSLGSLGACSTGGAVSPAAKAVADAEAARRRNGASVVRARLTPRPVTLNLGGRVVSTWAYGDSVPGPLLRATAGDVLRVEVDNQLPAGTSVHWHGIALRNDMDGVPGMTQDPISAGGSFRYEFTVPDPGTYFYHPHSGVQLDRGLYGVVVVDNPDESGEYDEEWVVVLDDWVDGTGRTPDDVLAELSSGGGSGGMGGMDHGSMSGMDHGSMGGMGGMMGEGMQSRFLGGAGDVDYPHYLVNGRTADAPVTLTGKPGQRVRIRLVNAGSDTGFRVALGGHRMTLTHSDGFPVVPVPTDALLIGMGSGSTSLSRWRTGSSRSSRWPRARQARVSR